MKTNTNSYTIIYSVVLVVVVALMLASVYQALKPQQDANVMLDTQKQILYALNQDRDMTNEEAAKLWQNLVEADDMIDANGVFRCKVDGETKYVIPVYGNGLWGPISGFIAVNGDKTTVFGAYFNHEGETAGLGAEIKDSKKWQDLFKGKELFANGDRDHVALSVEKKVTDPKTQVDCVTGATITSNGVADMLKAEKGGLQPYVKFFNAK